MKLQMFRKRSLIVAIVAVGTWAIGQSCKTISDDRTGSRTGNESGAENNFPSDGVLVDNEDLASLNVFPLNSRLDGELGAALTEKHATSQRRFNVFRMSRHWTTSRMASQTRKCCFCSRNGLVFHQKRAWYLMTAPRALRRPKRQECLRSASLGILSQLADE